MMNRRTDHPRLGQMLPRTLLLVCTILFACAASTAFAAKPESTDVETKASTAPEVNAPVSASVSPYDQGPAQESIPGGNLMLFAYFFIWLIPLFLLWRATQETARLEQRLSEMETLVRDATGSKS